MDKFTWYLLASGLSLGILMLAYHFLLGRLTHFRWNRTYLLASLGLALVLPLAILGSDLATKSFADYAFLFPGDQPGSPAFTSTPVMNPIEIPSTVTSPYNGMEEALQLSPPTQFSGLISWTQILLVLWTLYFIGLAIGLWRLGKGLFDVWNLYRYSPQEAGAGYKLIYPHQLEASFSFFNWVFIAPNDRDAPHREAIEAHESIHIRQLHSLDALLAELACKCWWFMPWMPVFRKSLKTTHEFLADQAAAKESSKSRYSKILLNTAIASRSLPVHYFAQSKIQQRILMLNKSTSSRRSRWAYLVLIPVLVLSFSLVIYLPLPADAHAPEVTEVAVDAPSLAGEALPSDATFQEGLEAMVAKIKSKSDYCQKILLRGQRYAPQIREWLTEENVPGDFLYLAMAESGFDPEAKSSMGAAGIWQFMPATARSYGMSVSDDIDDRKNVEASTRAAAQYLRKYKDLFGSWTAAALAYNRGPAVLKKENVSESLKSCYEFDHAQGYLYRILAMKQLFENPASFGLVQHNAFILPLKDYKGITSHFGPSKSPFDNSIRNHTGADFKARAGVEVVAIGDGKVTTAAISDEGRGNHIALDHAGNLSSQYNHLQTILVKPGNLIKAGDVIGTVGNTGKSTGPHLHLEISEKNIPVDPDLYLNLREH